MLNLLQTESEKHRKYFLMTVINPVTIIDERILLGTLDWKSSWNHLPFNVNQCYIVTFCVEHKCLIVHPIRVQREESIKIPRNGMETKSKLFRWRTIDPIKIITIYLVSNCHRIEHVPILECDTKWFALMSVCRIVCFKRHKSNVQNIFIKWDFCPMPSVHTNVKHMFVAFLSDAIIFNLLTQTHFNLKL